MGPDIKINFQLKPGEDGYPPVSVESLWARELNGFYVIDSIPFFTSEATVGDIVCARRDHENVLWFESVEVASLSSLVRVVFFDVTFANAIAEILSRIGCGVEHLREFKLLAVDVPASVDLSEVQDILVANAAKGYLDFEEPILRQ